jgi:glycerophosphoryl diester phosphodiesterase
LRDGAAPLFFRDFVRDFADLQWTLDVKPEHGQAIIDRLAELGQKDRRLSARLQTQAQFLFWRKDQEAYAQRKLGSIRCYARQDECMRFGLASLFGLQSVFRPVSAKIYSLPARFRGFRLFRPWLVRRMHAAGVRVLAYLPETTAETRAAIDAGVDQILTNLIPSVS